MNPRLQEMIAKIHAERNLPITEANLESAASSHKYEIVDKYGNLITLNYKQSEAARLGGDGNSFVLIGAAGTGKTTTQKALVQRLITSGRAGVLQAGDHKHLISGTPGIVVCAFTRRAVMNIRKNMPKDMQANCITIHKLLEYQPNFFEVMDEESGRMKNKMVFEETRTPIRPLPESIHTIIFEESSMLGTDLHIKVKNACPHNPQVVYLGDIQQLPPVFGPATLGFKLLELPVIELTEVYRQALESPIIELAHRILSGKVIPKEEYPKWKKPGLTIHPWKKAIDWENALSTAGLFFTQAADKGVYDPEQDIILIPFNKSFGTIELNKIIADHLAHKREAYIFQIIAGFFKCYFSVGDKVLYEKEDAIIVNIESNPTYSGNAFPILPSKTLDYWGHDHATNKSKETESEDDVDFLLSQVATGEKSEDRVNQASHIITIKMLDSDVEIQVMSAGEVNNLSLGYALTVHKSQGSEWRKVFFVLHQSHATMVSRELLYTGITRAREELYVICEPETFVNGIKSQRVKGNTIAEKAEYFKGKVKDQENLI